MRDDSVQIKSKAFRTALINTRAAAQFMLQSFDRSFRQVLAVPVERFR